MSVIHNILHYLNHPLGRLNRLATIKRILLWQFGTRMLGYDAVVPWVDGARLLVRRGMHGATGNIYVGLMEFEDMAFVLHLLRDGDEFLDVGANIGSYSILAASRKASVLAIEPVPATYLQLLDNVNLNNAIGQIFPKNIGVGARHGVLQFSTEMGPTNHVLKDNEPGGNAASVAVDALDAIANGWRPIMIKIDVEGFESAVLNGAVSILAQPSLVAVLIELNGLGARYGFSDVDIHVKMLGLGFSPVMYKPFERKLVPLHKQNTEGNTLYIRSSDKVSRRLSEARAFCWCGVSI